MSGRELDYIKDVFKSNYIAPVGEFLDRFEHAVMSYTGSAHALAVINGTAAIHLALRVLGVEKGDKVLASSFTFIGSVSPIIFQGAEPVFIDSDDSWNIDPNLVEDAIKKERPKAMIVTHLYGQMAKIEELCYLARKYNVFLIEDAAESLGATYKGKHSGTFGDLGVYSFNGNKIVTTGGGGMLVSDNKEWVDKARKLATQAREPVDWYEHTEIGYNYRLSNVLAAIGVAQMEVLEERVARKRQIFEFYRQHLSDIAEFMPEIPNSSGNRWLTTALFGDVDINNVVSIFKQKGIEIRPLWKPMHLQPVFSEAKAYVNGTSESLFAKGLCLPSGTQMDYNQIDRIVALLREVVVGSA